MVRVMNIMYNSGDGPNHSSDNYLKDRVEEQDKKLEGILNQTQGNLLLFSLYTGTDLFLFQTPISC